MKYSVLFALLVAVLPARGSAQGEQAVGSVEPADTSTAPAEPDEAKDDSDDDERGPYYKKVQGLLWFEFLVGPTSFDPDKYGSVTLSGGGDLDAPRLNGPEWGLAIGVGLGGFHLGAFYRQANYDDYKLLKVGLDIQGLFRFIPYVHPTIRVDLYYAGIVDGNPYSASLTNTNIDGGGFTLGAGVTIPIVRWISFTATFDWSVMGLAVRGDEPGGESLKTGIAGQEVGATFALTFHFIGVRRNN